MRKRLAHREERERSRALAPELASLAAVLGAENPRRRRCTVLSVRLTSI